jgi:hypothetical protein
MKAQIQMKSIRVLGVAFTMGIRMKCIAFYGNIAHELKGTEMETTLVSRLYD